MVYRNLTLFYPHGLISMEVETKGKTRWNVTMKLPTTPLFPETQLPSNPSSLSWGDFVGKITYHKVILLYQPRTDFRLSFLWQVLQLSPVSGGWMPTPFMSNQTTQSAVEHIRRAKIIAEKYTFWSSASPATLTPGREHRTTRDGQVETRNQVGAWETHRKDSAEGRVFPHKSTFFSRSASNSFPKQPQEHELTGAHRLAWILFNIQRCSLILLGISLEIPAKQGNSRASQTALEWTHCLKCAILQNAAGLQLFCFG